MRIHCFQQQQVFHFDASFNSSLIYNIDFKDRTVRVWDIENSSGPIGLISHPGPVISIVYDKTSNLLFSACGSYVRVWDGREGYTKAIRTLRYIFKLKMVQFIFVKNKLSLVHRDKLLLAM